MYKSQFGLQSLLSFSPVPISFFPVYYILKKMSGKELRHAFRFAGCEKADSPSRW